MVRLLVPEDFGFFALAMAIVEIIFMLGGFGVGMACIQLQEEDKVFDTGFVLSCGIAFILFIFGLIFSWLGREAYGVDTALFIAALCAMKAIYLPASIYLVFLDKHLLFRRSAFISGFSRGGASILALVFAFIGFGKWSLLIRELMSIGFITIAAILFSHYRFGFSFDKSTAIKIWRVSFGMFFLRMSDVLFNRVPNLLIGSLAGMTTLGLFDRGLYLSILPNSVLLQIYGKVGFSVFSKVKHQPEKITEGLEWNLFFTSRVTFLLAVLAFLFPELIMTGLFGEQWLTATPIFQGLAPIIILYPIFEGIKVGLMAIGKFTALTLSRSVSLMFVVLGILLAWLLEGQWELVPWSMSLGILVSSIMLVSTCKKNNINIDFYKSIMFPVVLGVLILSFDFFMVIPENFWVLAIYSISWFLLIYIRDKQKIYTFYRQNK